MTLQISQLAERVAELTVIFQKQQEMFGSPGYDPVLLQLLHNDLTEMKAQLDQHSSPNVLS